MSNKKHFQISQQAVEKLAVRFGTPLLVLSLDEIKKVVKANFDKSVEFVDIAEAEQYRISEKIRNDINK